MNGDGDMGMNQICAFLFSEGQTVDEAVLRAVTGRLVNGTAQHDRPPTASTAQRDQSAGPTTFTTTLFTRVLKLPSICIRIFYEWYIAFPALSPPLQVAPLNSHAYYTRYTTAPRCARPQPKSCYSSRNVCVKERRALDNVFLVCVFPCSFCHRNLYRLELSHFTLLPLRSLLFTAFEWHWAEHM